MIAKPKENDVIVEHCFGDFFGVTVEVPLVVDQKWNVKICMSDLAQIQTILTYANMKLHSLQSLCVLALRMS